ncbi:MAG: antibiotic biosynthesis monooxygenase [Vitreimonas sp.]
MAFNSITRLRLRSLFTLAAFARETRAIADQARAAPGFLGGGVLAEGWLVFWTRTSWESEAAMKAFRDSGAHRVSMPKLLDWCDEARVAHWEGEPERDWRIIHDRMAREGRTSKVRNPSKAHEAGRIGPLRRWAPEQPVPAAK